MFLSTYESNVDAKRRVSVPAAFRAVLKPGEDCVYLWPALDNPCLEGGGAELMQKYRRALSRLKPLDPRRQALEQSILARARPCKFDEGGRIVLDEHLCQRAHIAPPEKPGARPGVARFVGLGERFQLWSPEAHDQREEGWRQIALESGDLLDPFEDYTGEAGA
ncbi:division/cell wall cluster transcriptional repressor MraZ [bacterium]|nr:division/cell wall cluster transcriptional repressor MraZ [bacterium]